MEPILSKTTLPELVLARLRKAIGRGEWAGRLPAERTLSRELGVSRATLRLALDQLKREGWLRVEGKRTCLCRQPPAAPPDSMRTRRIVFLSPLPLERLPVQALYVYGELARRLAPLGATVQLATSPAFSHQQVDGYLDDLTTDLAADAWVLHRAPLEVQRYFQARARPTVLFGNAHRGIDLPSLQVDHPAALRHCISNLLRLGHDHHRIALVVPDSDLAGNRQLVESFRREARRVGHRVTSAQLLRHDEDGRLLPRLLERAARRQPPPSAYVVLRTSIAARVHGLLSHRLGFPVPGQASMVCLEDAPFMENLVPEMTRYHIDHSRIAQLVFSSLSRQLSSGIQKGWRHRPLVPELIPGETIAPPPA